MKSISFPLISLAFALLSECVAFRIGDRDSIRKLFEFAIPSLCVLATIIYVFAKRPQRQENDSTKRKSGKPSAAIILAAMVACPAAMRAEDQAVKIEIRNQESSRCDDLVKLKEKIPTDATGDLLRQALAACAMPSSGIKKPQDERQKEIGLKLSPIIAKAAFVVAPKGFTDILPYTSYNDAQSYSLFLFPSTEWSKNPDNKRLLEQFQSFGDAIGDKHLALWFAITADEIDVLRSKEYCDRFGLNYNDGPYVVTIQKSPATWKRPDALYTIQLGGISAERRIAVLNVLEQDLRTEQRINQRNLLYAEIENWLLSEMEAHKDLLKGLIKLN